MLQLIVNRHSFVFGALLLPLFGTSEKSTQVIFIESARV
jgi:hypothetical protein